MRSKGGGTRSFLPKIIIYLLFFMIFLWPQGTVKATEVWQQVGGNGLGDPNNTTVSTMEVWNNALYAGVGNDAGCRIYRSTNGTTWTKVNNDGFGHPHLRELYDFTAFGGQLYTDGLDDLHDDTSGEIWRSTNGTTWTQAGGEGLGNPNNNTGFYKFEVFNGMLYVGSRNPTEGGEILRTADGVNWSQTNNDGFGSLNNDGIMSLESYGGFLYAGTLNPTSGAELWRSADGEIWEGPVIDFGPYPGGLNAGINVIYVYQNDLYFGTINPLDGGQLWQWDGAVWTGVTDGLDNNNNIWFSIHPVTVNSSVYFGTRNEINGAEFWTANGSWETYSQLLTGFENPNNWALYALTYKDYLYLGYSNDSGIQIWRRYYSGSFFGIITKVLPAGSQGAPYSVQLKAAGGTKPYSYRIVKGSLPEGLQLNSQTGEISGLPRGSGEFQFTVEVQDSGKKSQKAQHIFTLKIVAGVSEANLGGVTILPETGANFLL